MEKVIHRFWAGPKEMPEEYAEYGHQWALLNPGWTLRMWEESDIAEFPTLSRIFDDLYLRDAGRHGIELYVQMADVMGYAIIEKFGGIYVNCDVQPIKPLPTLPEGAWASYENESEWDVVNAVIGSPGPHNEFWYSLVAGLSNQYFANRLEEMVVSTGPRYLTKKALEHPRLIHVFGVNVFNPVHWSRVERGGDASSLIAQGLPEETIAVHHWGHRKDLRTNHIESATQYAT